MIEEVDVHGHAKDGMIAGEGITCSRFRLRKRFFLGKMPMFGKPSGV